MFVLTAATAPTDPPSRSAFLLGVVRRLIDYGKELANRLRGSGAGGVESVAMAFGTRQLALILARIARGLLLARALEARLVRSAGRLDAAPRRSGARSARVPRPARVAASAATSPGDPLAAMPSEAEIAAAVRSRPIGALIADICRDLGILPSHPLWHDLQRAIIRHGGNYARLVMDMLDRPFRLAPALPGSTGPPAVHTV